MSGLNSLYSDGSCAIRSGTPRHTTSAAILWPEIAYLRRPTSSKRSIVIASIHPRSTSSSSSGCQTAETNSCQVIVSDTGIRRAIMFAAGTPRTCA